MSLVSIGFKPLAFQAAIVYMSISKCSFYRCCISPLGCPCWGLGALEKSKCDGAVEAVG